MQVLKTREKSKLLQGLQLLNRRMTLSIEEKQYLYSLEKGYEGEMLFDEYVKKCVSGEVLVLNDLLLVINGASVQLDTLVITADGLRIYEVKNYKGNYQMQSGRLLSLSGQEVPNPLSQLNRSEIKLRQLVHSLGSDAPIHSTAVFVNPTFFLYHANISDGFIFTTNLLSHLTDLSKSVTQLSSSQYLLAEKLLALHQVEVPYEKQLPTYDYESLRKCLTCSSCGQTTLRVTQRSCSCSSCDYKTTVEATLMTNIEDFMYLFPDKKLTTSAMADWCGGQISSKRIRRILQTHFVQKGETTATYYDAKPLETKDLPSTVTKS